VTERRRDPGLAQTERLGRRHERTAVDSHLAEEFAQDVHVRRNVERDDGLFLGTIIDFVVGPLS
jgi:hypothetical protein